MPHEPIIFKLFDKFKDAPLLGLEYLVEIIQGPNVDPTYECLLCHTTLESKDVISCVVSARHRLKYLVSQTSVSCKKTFGHLKMINFCRHVLTEFPEKLFYFAFTIFS